MMDGHLRAWKSDAKARKEMTVHLLKNSSRYFFGWPAKH
jgi:hypothetical protein